MSSPGPDDPPPFAPSSGAPPYGAWAPPTAWPAPAPKPRPSGWWFVAGGALLVAAVASLAVLLLWTVDSFGRVAATVEADGEPHPVTVPAGEEQMLWDRADDPHRCLLVDREDGGVVVLESVTASYRRSGGSGEWAGDSRFDPGSGRLEVTCAAAGGPVQIGTAPDVPRFVGGLVATVLLPLALGLAGFLVLLVTGILWLVRPPRSRV